MLILDSVSYKIVLQVIMLIFEMQYIKGFYRLYLIT